MGSGWGRNFGIGLDRKFHVFIFTFHVLTFHCLVLSCVMLSFSCFMLAFFMSSWSCFIFPGFIIQMFTFIFSCFHCSRPTHLYVCTYMYVSISIRLFHASCSHLSRSRFSFSCSDSIFRLSFFMFSFSYFRFSCPRSAKEAPQEVRSRRGCRRRTCTPVRIFLAWIPLERGTLPTAPPEHLEHLDTRIPRGI